jgi:hypothetical protein
MFDQIEGYARDRPDGTPGWAILLDPDLCPAEALPYLAQFVGVKLPEGLTEAQQRFRIKATDGFNRGKPSAIIAAAQQFLTGNKTVIIRERDPSVDTVPIRAGIANWSKNPSLELPGTTGWNVNHSSGNVPITHARQAGWAKSGGWALRVSSSNPNDAVNRRTATITDTGNLGFPVPPGGFIGIRTSIRVEDPGNGGFNMVALWYQADGTPSATVSTSSPLIMGLVAGSEADLIAPLAVPNDASFLAVRTEGLSNVPLDTVDFWVDDLMVAPIQSLASPVPAYADGNFPGYVWGGTVDGSVTYKTNNGAYGFTVLTYTSETPDAAVVLAALMEQKPAGLLMNYSTVPGANYLLIRTTYADYAAVKAAFATYSGLRNNLPGT